MTSNHVIWITAADYIGDAFCKNYYERLPKEQNYCSNYHFVNRPNQPDGGQWCYVSSECQNLHGGNQVTTGISWKGCDNKKDSMMRNMTLDQLQAWQASDDLDIGILVKFAYPVFEKIPWESVRAFFGLEGAPLEEHGAKMMQDIVDSKQPLVFSSVNGHPPFGVIVGDKTYEVRLTEGWEAQWNASHMGKITELVCVKGCGDIF